MTRRVFEAEQIARNYREVFTDKPVKKRHALSFTWPRQLQHVGASLAVGYASDKWKSDGDLESYLHLAESKNRALCRPGFLHYFDRQNTRCPTIGPMVSFDGVPMPKHFADLGYFEEARFQLHTSGSDSRPKLGSRDDGVVAVFVKHGMLGGSLILWIVPTLEALVKKAAGEERHRAKELLAKARGGEDLTDDETNFVEDACERRNVHFRDNEPFLLVYTTGQGSEPGGVHIIVTGEELEIEGDGITG